MEPRRRRAAGRAKAAGAGEGERAASQPGPGRARHLLSVRTECPVPRRADGGPPVRPVRGAHPFHRSWLQAQYDDYVASEVFPFIDSVCQTPGIPITTYGASLGAYHAANTLFKHPDHVKRCYALSGIYDMRDSMDGMYDDNFYFNNPVDYMANQNDPWFLHQYRSCDIHLATGCGPWEVPSPTYRMSEVLKSRGIPHHLDDWGPKGGHEWPYWHHQMWVYVGQHY